VGAERPQVVVSLQAALMRAVGEFGGEPPVVPLRDRVLATAASLDYVLMLATGSAGARPDFCGEGRRMPGRYNPPYDGMHSICKRNTASGAACSSSWRRGPRLGVVLAAAVLAIGPAGVVRAQKNGPGAGDGPPPAPAPSLGERVADRLAPNAIAEAVICPLASAQNIFASTRFTCFVTASSRQERSRVVPLLCVFSSSRHSGDHIFPITFRFPSGTGGYPQY